MVFKSVFTITKLFITVVVVILYIHYFIPQSWGFYTVESKQPLYNIYPVHNGIADKEELIGNNMSYGMGVSWKGKILFTELYNITKNKNLPWRPLIEDSLNYITQHENYNLISTGGKHASFKGKFLITKTNRPSYQMIKEGKRFPQLKQYILADIR